MLHNLILTGSVRIVYGGFGNTVYRIHSFDNLAESSVSAIQMRGIFMHDKELREYGRTALAMERTPSVCFRVLETPFWENSPLML